MSLHRKFMIGFFVTAFLILAAIATFDYHFDYYKMFSPSFYRKVNASLHEGKYIVRTHSWAEYWMNWAKVQAYDVPDTLIVGSSRSMYLGKKVFPERNILNCWVPAGELYDDITVAGLYLYYKGTFPSHVMMEASPWLFNTHPDEKHQTILKIYYDYFYHPRLPSFWGSITDYWALKFSQFPSLFSLKSGWQALREGQKKSFYEVFSKEEDFQGKDGLYYYPDGSLLASDALNLTDVEVKTRLIKDLDNGKQNNIENYAELDPSLMKDFESFIAWMRRRGVEVTLYLPAHHPILYDYLHGNNRYRMVFQAENYFRAFAAREHIPLIGSYSPYDLGLESVDFYDGVHMRPSGFQKVFH